MKLYTEAILWFLNCGLLPEKTSARFQDLFPVRQLEKLYSTKRSKWQSKFAQWLKTNHFLAEELKNVGLLIDGLCKQLGSRLVVSKLERQLPLKFPKKCLFIESRNANTGCGIQTEVHTNLLISFQKRII